MKTACPLWYSRDVWDLEGWLGAVVNEWASAINENSTLLRILLIPEVKGHRLCFGPEHQILKRKRWDGGKQALVVQSWQLTAVLQLSHCKYLKTNAACPNLL